MVDGQGCMKGIVTADDVIDVMREEDTKEVKRSAVWKPWTNLIRRPASSLCLRNGPAGW